MSAKKMVLPVVIIIILLLAMFTFFGIGGLSPYINDLKLGLDIEGGVAVVYEGVQGDKTTDEFYELIDKTKDVLARRINQFGLTEPVITKQGDTRIRIELPGEKNIQKALESIGKTAVLEFYQVNEGQFVQQGIVIAEDFPGKLLFKGDLLSNAELGFDKNNNPGVSLNLSDEARDIFYESSKDIVENYSAKKGQIAIVLDGQIISAPMVEKVLNSKDLIIQGKFTTDEAVMLASLIKGGSLPLDLKEVKTSFVNATLGIRALEKSITAGIIGFILIIIIMIIRYRFAGVITSMALILYASGLFIVMVLFKATLTLPGIAGLVLSIGMAVDANVIIFERFGEELALGKSLKSSLRKSFKKAMRAIIDANITTLIASVILFNFGEGPIKGFAVTLMIGIVLSMFTSIVITRGLLNSSLEYKALKNKKLFYTARLKNENS